MNFWKTLTLSLSLSFALQSGQAIAGQEDCQIHGGGIFDARVFINGVASPEASGVSQFGGSISTVDGCFDLNDPSYRVEGPWFIRLADGSRFGVTDLDYFTLRRDGVLIGDLMGFGTYDGQVVYFFLQFEDFEDSTNHTDHLIVIAEDPVTRSVILKASGDVIRGDFQIVEPDRN